MMNEPKCTIEAIADQLRGFGIPVNDEPRHSANGSCISSSLNAWLRGAVEPLMIVAVPDGARLQFRDLRRTIVGDLGIPGRALVIILAIERLSMGTEFPNRWVVVPTEDFVNRLSEDKTRFLVDFVIEHFPLSTLCPYNTRQAVLDGRMFFGRQEDIRDLSTGGGAHIVVGPRRGGKTSLALNVERHLKQDCDFRYPIGPRAGMDRYMYSVCFLDLQLLVRENDIWDNLLRNMGLEQRDLSGGMAQKLLVEPRRNPVKKTQFELLGSLLDHKYKRTVLLLDEVDTFIAQDARQGWPILSKLRALVDKPKAGTKIAFFGYEKLHIATQTDEFPFYGRCEPLRIANLENDAVRRLIEEPTAELGIRIVDLPQVVDRIDHATGGMANLIQDVCRALLNSQQVERTRTITVRDVIDLLQQQRGHLIRGVYDALASLNDPLPRLIAYTAAPMQRDIRLLPMLEQLRNEHHVDVADTDVRAGLEYLYLHNVFHGSAEDQTYAFASILVQQRLQSDLEQASARTLLDTLRARTADQYGELPR